MDCKQAWKGPRGLKRQDKKKKKAETRKREEEELEGFSDDDTEIKKAQRLPSNALHLIYTVIYIIYNIL